MPYRIRRGEPVQEAVERIAMEQVDRARAELRDRELEAAEAVHQARKRFKKLRALLRLLRPSLEKMQFKAENPFFRDLGRRLAGARDAQVLLDTLDALCSGEDQTIDPQDLQPLRDRLLADRDAHLEDDQQGLAKHREEVAAALDGYTERLAAWKLDAAGFRALGPGLKRSYRQGRKALARTRRHPTDGDFHEWRKRVKDHWYHSRLLRGVWRGPMKAYSRELKRLSDLLGDDHDLAVFRQALEAVPADVLVPETKARLLDRVSTRQEELRGRAWTLGGRVYAEPPKRLHRRWKAYWGQWRPTS